MKKPYLRRALAYIIDVILIFMVFSMLTKISIFNPKYEEYQEKYSEYEKFVEENAIETIDKDKIQIYAYELSKLNVYNIGVNIAITFLYFAVFQYFNNGKSIGKKLMGLQVVGIDKKRVKFIPMVIRTIIIGSVLTLTITLICLNYLSRTAYLNMSTIISLIDMVLVYGSILMIIFRKDYRGIHDFAAKTMVIGTKDSDQVENKPEEANYVEEEVLEENKEIKVKKTTDSKKKTVRRKKNENSSRK